MGKYDKYFQLAKEKGIDALELFVSSSYRLSFSLFHSEVDSYSLADSRSLSVRGIYKGKIGYANTEKIDKSTPEFVINAIVENALAVDKDDPAIIFPGSLKYKKKNTYNPEIKALPISKKMANLHEIETKLKNADPRIAEVESVGYCESESEVLLINSYGLNLKNKSNYYYYDAAVMAKENGDTKTGDDLHLSNDPKDFIIDEFVKKITTEALSKLGALPCASKSYPVILDPKVTASLLDAYLDGASSEEVQKKSSLLADKLKKPVASSKITVTESPLTTNCFFRYFDDEGVATSNKVIIKKGVLETFFYNLLTAKKDNVTTTGNGYRGGSKVGIGFVNITLKPGKKTQNELIGLLKEGLLISEVQGLHAGLNSQSGNFSLQASGFMIENGKKTKPVNLITIAGNLADLFMNVKEVGNDSELQLSSVTAPSILVKKLAVSGK